MSILKITIICVGKLKEQAYQQLDKEFRKRLSPFMKLKIIELPEEPYRAKDDLDRIRQMESEAIQKNIPANSLVILLKENGTIKDSKEFAQSLERLGSLGQEIVFVIGSGVGLHPVLNEQANYVYSLSKLTFPHNLARIVLLEQLYRATTLMLGKKYHK
ncbi:MAG TPA: 23S rRNA (pseudouridine(1915)-N(3))-methyltransferase RlmH [Candidatus Doudnabacteria bacterium]|nr:23S rRNA (pseudouridine(1915)-N(3))-methyltransferase RlmH [Candidatus Doudnabacteria bacterium]